MTRWWLKLLLVFPAKETQHAADTAELRVKLSPSGPQEATDAVCMLSKLGMYDDGVTMDHQKHPASNNNKIISETAKVVCCQCDGCEQDCHTQ